ncbi:MAG: hypothetical protein FD167_252 [bacterium]|nr:MAG: hypothetical protein FD167_252 [bacterium]
MSILRRKNTNQNINVATNNTSNYSNVNASNTNNANNANNGNNNSNTGNPLPEWTTPITPDQMMAIAHKDSIKRKPNIFWGRAYSGTAQLQQNNLLLTVLIFVGLSYGFWNSYQWRLLATELGYKQWVVFDRSNGVTTPKDARTFQTGASDEEIQAMAWNMTRWVIAASSSNVETAYAEARQFMTSEMRSEFDKSFGEKVDDLKQLGIYRKIENANVRQITEKDLPAGTTVRPSRYDVIVTGDLYTYRESDKDQLAKGPFAYRLRLVPLNTRSIQNPTALLVNSLEEVDYQSTLTKKDEKK